MATAVEHSPPVNINKLCAKNKDIFKEGLVTLLKIDKHTKPKFARPKLLHRTVMEQ